MPLNEPYRGPSRKLVLAFDVGTTYSGISYCMLDPGEVPKIHGVSKYPAQEHVGGDNKIPSILYYDRQGAVQAVGAEALQQHVIEQARKEGWVKAEWWKLHLRPKQLASSSIRDEELPPLPQGKDAVQVLTDFLRYLFNCARTYFIESHYAIGESMWKSMESNIEFILTHPNGWGGTQQQQIRSAAARAGLVPRKKKRTGRIHLLTEGEASLHFCITRMLESDSLANLQIGNTEGLEELGEESENQGVVIIDAGGGTIDLSAYSIKLSPPREFKEIAPAECHLQGSVVVTQRAHRFLRAKLANSQYGSPTTVQRMKEIFDQTTKLRFRNASEPQYIGFGAACDRDPQYDIRSGQLKLAGEDVATFFEPSVEAIVDAFQRQQQAAANLQIQIKHAFLVGGYAASDFLYSSLQLHPAFSGVRLSKPPNHVNKAVADGAVSSYIAPLVTSRAAKLTYGIACSTLYDPSRPDHQERAHMQFASVTGFVMLPCAFQSILEKGTQVSEQQEFRHSFSRVGHTSAELTRAELPIIGYSGDLSDPQWIDREPASFTKLCSVVADTSAIASTLPRRRGLLGRNFYCLDVDVVLLFGLTELKAQIRWEHEGVEKRGPATIVYN